MPSTRRFPPPWTIDEANVRGTLNGLLAAWWPTRPVLFYFGATDRQCVAVDTKGDHPPLLDEGEILLKPTDTVIVQGANHGWSNHSNEPCLFTAVMIDVIPRQ